MELDEGLEYVKTGEAVIITGAGFSYGAKNIQGEFIPGVKDLKAAMLKELGIPRQGASENEVEQAENATFKQVADLFKSEYGNRKFFGFLRDVFTDT